MYIHYHYTRQAESTDTAGYLAAAFSEAKVQQQYRNSIILLKQQMSAVLKAQTPNNPKINDEEFFNLLDDFERNVLGPAAQKMASEVATTGMSRADLAEATNSIQGIQQTVSRFTNIIQQITNSSFSKNPLPVLTADMLNGNTSVSAIKQKYREAYLNNDTTFKVDGSYSRAIASHASQVNTILADLSAIQAIGQGGMNSFSSDIKSQTLKSLLWSIYFRLNIVVGFVSEDNLAKFIPEYIAKSVHVPKEITITAEGTGKSEMFNVKTEDVSVNLNLKEMLDGKEGQIEVRLPGISVKRTNIKANNMAKIHIKTNANLGNLLSRMDAGSLSDFYNAYADYNMAIKIKKPNGKIYSYPAELNRSAAPAMQNMYNYFHAAILPYALSGSLTAGDLAYFMVINNQVYNAVEILEKVMNIDDDSLVQSNISTHQTAVKNAHNEGFKQDANPDLTPTEGDARSKYIYDVINSLNITMELLLSLK